MSPDELNAILAMPIASLCLSVRASNCLEAANINTIADLVRMTEDQLLSLRSFGRTSLTEVTRKLQDIDLHLGMIEINYTPCNRWRKRDARRTPHEHCRHCGACLLDPRQKKCPQCGKSTQS